MGRRWTTSPQDRKFRLGGVPARTKRGKSSIVLSLDTTTPKDAKHPAFVATSRIAPRTPFPRTLFQPFTLAPTHGLIPEPTAGSRNAGRGLKWRVPRRSHSGVGHTAASQN